MSEYESPISVDRIQLASESKEAYSLYINDIFDELEAESDPLRVDLTTSELMLLVARHSRFTPAERLLQLSYVSHYAMMVLRKLADTDPWSSVATQAELIHTAYAEVYGQAILGLAKMHPPDDMPSAELQPDRP